MGNITSGIDQNMDSEKDKNHRKVEFKNHNKKQNDINYAIVCEKFQSKYDDHIIEQIDTLRKRDPNVVIGLNFEEEVMLWCSSSRLGKCKYKFMCDKDCIKFRSEYVLFRHTRCSGCDSLKYKAYPCFHKYHYFATIRLHTLNIVKYMESNGISYKVEE